MVAGGMFCKNDIEHFRPTKNDYIIAVDGGYNNILKTKFVPNILIGDMDSIKIKNKITCKTIKLNPQKDDTDTIASINYAKKIGIKKIKFFGGVQGVRFDHLLANIQTLLYCYKEGIDLIIYGNNYITKMFDNKIEFSADYKGFISIFSAVCNSYNVTIKGLKYQLDNKQLHNYYPLGVSNEFIGKNATIIVKKGILNESCKYQTK
jgi:thiamine pyrophosphokinase